MIPVYNEEAGLKNLQERLHRIMEHTKASYEIIYVDDGSKDKSLKIMKELKNQYPKIQIIAFKKNKGQSPALFAGFKAAQGEWIFSVPRQPHWKRLRRDAQDCCGS